MKKDGWIRFALEIGPQDFVMLEGALREGGVEIVEAPVINVSSRGAHLDKKYAGKAFFVSENKKFEAEKIVSDFMLDFGINPSKLIFG